ncbi:MAG: UDP-N-acetylglucosamine 1-carboxyvinyltransferase [Defluviicoccus sp.]|nr:UDP-N-acetylglucosamine 1-carboxyvinyltransferase [Defluviicoccus sp.]
MKRIHIRGGTPLSGIIPISGAKNAALPLLAAGLLTEGTLTLDNVPHVVDIESMLALLAELGATVETDANTGTNGSGSGFGLSVRLSTPAIRSTTAVYDLVRKMRASVLVLGPLVARFGHARVSLPGGCAIGTRPIDLHLKALQAMGAEVGLDAGYVEVSAPKGLTGAVFTFPSVSVTGTENALMAAVLARGETRICNAAREPEIGDLARCLVAMGADITGIDTDTLKVQGVERLGSARHAVIPDRIETGTFAIAAAITGGSIELQGTRLELIGATADALRQAGIAIEPTAHGIRVARRDNGVRGVDVMTEPFPGFPTDMQAQIMALMTVADGAAMITETVFENRFMHVPELCRMGANINVHSASAIIRGVPALSGAPVMATDLRASVSLVLAGLAARGETIVNRVYHLDRGYERLEDKLAACGATIERADD